MVKIWSFCACEDSCLFSILLEICWPSFTLKTFSLFLFQFSWKALNRILHLRKPLTSNQSDDLHLAFFKELLLVEVSTPYSTWMFINYVRILLDVLYLDVFCSKMIHTLVAFKTFICTAIGARTLNFIKKQFLSTCELCVIKKRYFSIF